MSEDKRPAEIGEEERLRALWYSLLGGLIAAAPDARYLKRLRKLEGDESDFGSAVQALAEAAAAASPDAVKHEHFNLFIGVGESELLPYGSYYLTGFLHGKPLAILREDMARLGVARAESVKEPEDHIASLCETMAGLISGEFDAPRDLLTQQRFFDRHLAPWAMRFFEDLEAAPSAAFYKPVGRIGRHFMTIEREAFSMAA